jgi:hypothetical protein
MSTRGLCVQREAVDTTRVSPETDRVHDEHAPATGQKIEQGKPGARGKLHVGMSRDPGVHLEPLGRAVPNGIVGQQLIAKTQDQRMLQQCLLTVSTSAPVTAS